MTLVVLGRIVKINAGRATLPTIAAAQIDKAAQSPRSRFDGTGRHLNRKPSFVVIHKSLLENGLRPNNEILVAGGTATATYPHCSFETPLLVPAKLLTRRFEDAL
jgi:hypothetical protein